MKKLSSLSRRQFIQGSGIALSLPAFESFAVEAANTDESPRRILAIGNHLGFHPPSFFPDIGGVNYASSDTLKNIEKHRKNFTVFSNLDHDTTGGHSGVNAFLTGIRKEESGGFPEKKRLSRPSRGRT